MSYNLTDKQKSFARQLVEALRSEQLEEEFLVTRSEAPYGSISFGYKGPEIPVDKRVLNSLEQAGLLLFIQKDMKTYTCRVTGRLYDAVDSDFPDSFTPSSVTMHNPQFGGGFANFVHGNQTGGTINNNRSETPSLAEAATEIQNLLRTLEASNPQATESDKTAFLSAMIPPTQRQRFISALQSAGSAAIDEIPYGSVFKALVNGWRNPNT
mgnify:CR=1 FL=1